MDIHEQMRRWEAVKGYIRGRASLEHTASKPALARKHGGHGYVVIAEADDRNTRSGRSRQVVFGPLDVTLDEFLDSLESAYGARDVHPIFQT